MEGLERSHCVISIPFSTIKSLIASGAASRAQAFQFHLVRLKVITGRSNKSINKISIPFSTIKSRKKQKMIEDFWSFQFHLVRLKERLSKPFQWRR